jgi:hypothetical protein
MRTETSVQITAGLTAGDLVITSGIQQLRSGQPVSVAASEETSVVPKKPPGEKEGAKPLVKKPATVSVADR